MNMKKITLILALGAALAISGCSNASSNEKPDEPAVGIANPWREVTEEEAKESTPNLFKAPEGATGVTWRIMDDGTSDHPLVELDFDYDGLSFCARAKYGAAEDEDISGMYYDWTVTDDATLATWAGGLMQGKTYRYVGENEYADLITWYDIEVGIAYSLSTTAKDLDGFDIQAVAEAMAPGGRG